MIILKPIKVLMLFVFVLMFGVLQAQQQVTLKMCHDSAEVHFPLIPQKAKLLAINQLKLDNLNTNYLPGLTLNAKATYQSDVTSFPDLPIPGIALPEMNKDQYAATLDVTQLIYDGGLTKAAKKMNNLGNRLELQKIEVDLYKVKEQINQLFFASLLLQENKKILQLNQETIKERRKTLQSAVENGILQISDLNELDAELLKLDQQIIELQSQKQQLLFAISELTGMAITISDRFEIPKTKAIADEAYQRPEHQLFADQMQLLEANMETAGKKRMPNMAAFATVGYGNPGLNMFSQDWDSYYLLGAKISWKIWDWKYTNREKQQLTLEQGMIVDSENAFNQQLSISINETEEQLKKLRLLADKDQEIITLREKISKRTADQLENGTKTTADYIRDLNAEKQARLNLTTREIQQVQVQINRLVLTGKPLFTN